MRVASTEFTNQNSVKRKESRVTATCRPQPCRWLDKAASTQEVELMWELHRSWSAVHAPRSPAPPPPAIISWPSAPLTLHRGTPRDREGLTPGEKARLRGSGLRDDLQRACLGVLYHLHGWQRHGQLAHRYLWRTELWGSKQAEQVRNRKLPSDQGQVQDMGPPNQLNR